MTDYAKLGTVVLLKQKAAPYAQGPRAGSLTQRNPRGEPWTHGCPPRNQHVTGWTTPTTIYEKMREIDPGARELNALILANSRKPGLKAAWEAWYPRWLAFFAKYQSDFAKMGALFYTDDLARTTEDFRSTYASFRATYVAEKDDKGLPLIAPTTPVPNPLPDPSAKKPGGDGGNDNLGIQIPWWFWVLGGGGLVVGGYFLYRSIQRTAHETNAKRKAIETGVLPKLIGDDLAKAASARDPAPTTLAPSGLYDHDPPSFTHDEPSSSDAATSDEDD